MPCIHRDGPNTGYLLLGTTQPVVWTDVQRNKAEATLMALLQTLSMSSKWQLSTLMGHGHSVNLSYWEVILMHCLAARQDNSSTRWPGSVGSDGSYHSVGHHCVYSHSGCCCTVYHHLVQEVNKQPLLSS